MVFRSVKFVMGPPGARSSRFISRSQILTRATPPRHIISGGTHRPIWAWRAPIFRPRLVVHEPHEPRVPKRKHPLPQANPVSDPSRDRPHPQELRLYQLD